MGNADLVIIFNDEKVVIVTGKEYESRTEAIKLAIEKWEEYVREMEDVADFPEELDFEIKNIKIYIF